MSEHGTDADAHGRHDLPAAGRPGSRRRRPTVFGVLAVLLCVLLGAAIVTQVRQTESGDSLDSARPADLVVLLDSLHRREALLNQEVAELQRTLAALREAGSNDYAAIADAEARLAALSILVGTVPATGPGVTLTIDDPAAGVGPETMLDVINELRAAGVEAMEIRSSTGEQGDDPGTGTGGQEDGETGSVARVRVGVDTWVTGEPRKLLIDDQTFEPPYSVLAIGDPPALAAAINIPGGAVDAVQRVGGTITTQQSDRIDVTAVRKPKPRQYAQPAK